MLRALRSSFFSSVLRVLPASVLLMPLLVSPALAKPATAADTAPPLLPTDFAGWSLSATAEKALRLRLPTPRMPPC